MLRFYIVVNYSYTRGSHFHVYEGGGGVEFTINPFNSEVFKWTHAFIMSIRDVAYTKIENKMASIEVTK